MRQQYIDRDRAERLAQQKLRVKEAVREARVAAAARKNQAVRDDLVEHQAIMEKANAHYTGAIEFSAEVLEEIKKLLG